MDRGGTRPPAWNTASALLVSMLLPAGSVWAASGRTTEEGFRNDMFIVSSLQALLLVLLLLWYLVLARRRELDSTVRLPFQAFCKEHERVLTRLDTLTARHRQVAGPGAGDQPPTGETLQCIQAVEALLAGVSHTWLEAMEARSQIEAQLRSHVPLGPAVMARMRAQLAKQCALDPAHADLTTCEETLSRLEHAAAEAGSLVEAIEGLLEAARKNMEEIRGSGLSVLACEPDRVAIEGELVIARGRMAADPLGMESVLQEIQSRAAHLADWTARLLYHRRGLDEAWSLMHAVANETIACRRGGHSLSEDGGNPDPMLRQARGEHDAARLALERGEASLAERHLDQSFAWCAQARQAIQRQAEARAFCEEKIPALHRRAELYIAELQEAEERQQQLEAGFAASSWEDVASALESARGLFESCRPLMAEAEEASGSGPQRFFHAEDLLVHIEQQLQRGGQFLLALTARADSLQRIRDGVRKGAEEVERLREQVAEKIRQAPHTVCACTRKLHQDAEKNWISKRGTLSEPRPDWPLLDNRARLALATYRSLSEQIVEEAQAHDEALALMKQLRDKEREVEALLRQHHEQHERAHALYEQSREALGQMEKDLAVPGIDWLDAVSRLTAIHDQFQRAARWALDGQSPAQQATREVEEAEAALHAAKSHYRFGFSADASSAEARLGKARHALMARRYGEALDEASNAATEARLSLRNARRAARERQDSIQRIGVRFDFEGSGARQEDAPAFPDLIASPPLESRPTFPSRTWSPSASTAGTRWIASAPSTSSAQAGAADGE